MIFAIAIIMLLCFFAMLMNFKKPGQAYDFWIWCFLTVACSASIVYITFWGSK